MKILFPPWNANIRLSALSFPFPLSPLLLPPPNLGPNFLLLKKCPLPAVTPSAPPNVFLAEPDDPLDPGNVKTLEIEAAHYHTSPTYSPVYSPLSAPCPPLLLPFSSLLPTPFLLLWT